MTCTSCECTVEVVDITVIVQITLAEMIRYLRPRPQTSTKSLSFCVTIFSASFTDFTLLLPQSHDCNRYVKHINTGTSTALTAETHYLLTHDFPHTFDL